LIWLYPFDFKVTKEKYTYFQEAESCLLGFIRKIDFMKTILELNNMSQRIAHGASAYE